MCRHQWRFRKFGHIPKTLLIEMREVEHNAKAIAGADQLSPRVCQPRTGIGRMGKLERHAVSESIRSTPDYTKRAQSCLVENLERVQSRINSLCSLEVQDRSENALTQTCHQFTDGTNNLELFLCFGLKPEQACRYRHRHS